MANNIENVIGKIMLEGVLKDLFVKTTGTLVTMANGKSAETVIAEILSSIEALPTGDGVDVKIKTANDALYNKIMGIANEETTVNEAYDTLKEVADYLVAHGDVVQGFTADISGLKSAVQTLQNIGATKVEASNTNGNIKIDGQEVTVYTPPETISADKVTETNAKQFISKSDKETLLGRTQIFTGDTQPENMKDGDIWLQPVSAE